MAMHTVEDLFEHELNDIYAGEQSLVDALEEMAGESVDREIKKGFTQHRKETQGHVKRLEKVFKLIGRKPDSTSCPGIEGLLKEKKTFMRERPTEELVEFFNVGAGQKVERYEITAYESLIDMADKLGFTDAVELLEQNLHEEEATLNKLKMIASEYDVTDATEDEETASSRR
jgi:ferritin-like metal-binding protein YciE